MCMSTVPMVSLSEKINHLSGTELTYGIVTAAMAVDEAMKETGLKRIECQDVPDPSGMKHKQMRYEGIIDMDSDEVYWR